VDDDGDEFVDCKDADCAPTPPCMGIEDCSNGLDDDGDGAIDCEDDNCLDGCGVPPYLAVMVRRSAR
jgi:hypothetical protein